LQFLPDAEQIFFPFLSLQLLFSALPLPVQELPLFSLVSGVLPVLFPVRLLQRHGKAIAAYR